MIGIDKKEIAEICELVSRVDGFLTNGEGGLLYQLAKEVSGEGTIVEIGSWKGKSTIWLGRGSLAGKGREIHAIDPHVGSIEHHKNGEKVWTFDIFKENIHKGEVDDLVIPHVKMSSEVAADFDEPVELLFIDGAHDYDSVREDFEMWLPKVIDGGVIAFHDTLRWPGPRKVVREEIYRSDCFKDVGFVDSITYGQKVEQNSEADRKQNRRLMLQRDAYWLVDNLKLKDRFRKYSNRVRNKVKRILE
jgi:predicted O-methyltransferase YrrM